jgi:hypothetical protein
MARRGRRSGTRGSTVTYAERRRRGEADGSRSTQRRKKGERGRLGERTRWSGALTRAKAMKVTMAWRARTCAVGSGAAVASDMAVGRRVRQGERPGCQGGAGRGGRRSGRGHGAVRTAPLWRGTRVAATRRERLTGGTPRQRFFELKIHREENCSKQIARS